MLRAMLAMGTVILLAVAGSVDAAEPRVRLADNGAVLVDGKPFLPIFVWAQPMQLIDFHKELGVNVLHPGAAEDETKAYLDALHAADMLALVNLNRLSEEVVGHPAILAWTTNHEMDSPRDAPYTADRSGDATIIWIEGEKPTRHSFKQNGWLKLEHDQLSGGQWLVATEAGAGSAVYDFTVPTADTYTLWVREFYKPRANPTIWTLNDRPPQQTPRSLGIQESRSLGSNRAVGWSKYGQVELSKGEHRLILQVAPGRTQGGADAPVDTETVLWALDAICMTTADMFPPAVQAPPVPRHSPDLARRNHETVKKADPNALTWGIFSGAIGAGRRVPDEVYKAFMKVIDIAAFDLYPVTGFNRPHYIPLVPEATARLVAWAPPGQPVWACIESSNQNLSWTPKDTPGPTPAQMRVQIWSCIASGAKGIGYFTIAFDPFRWVELPEAIKAEMKRSNAELTALTGPIVMGDTTKKLTVRGDEVEDQYAKNRALRAIRKEYEGKTYVIAANVVPKVVEPSFTLEGHGAGAVKVWKQGRTIEMSEGTFTDTFEPLAVHVYVIE